MRHKEQHFSERIGWLRAAVLGANDGIVSTASLVVGVATAEATRGNVIVAGVAGLVAGAMSMAAGEYVSVSSQADTENADLARERKELASDGEFELAELTEIYVQRGLDEPLARQVAQQLMAHDALGAHARDELGISEHMSARPVQAALASAASFAVGAVLPLATVFLSPEKLIPIVVSSTSLAFLALLGGISARAGTTRRRTRYLLGSACDGGDCGNWLVVRRCDVSRAGVADLSDHRHWVLPHTMLRTKVSSQLGTASRSTID
ncbi:MAG: VIT family protein [Pirellulaceae bacterium]